MASDEDQKTMSTFEKLVLRALVFLLVSKFGSEEMHGMSSHDRRYAEFDAGREARKFIAELKKSI